MTKDIAKKIFESRTIELLDDGIYTVRLDGVFCHEITTPTAILDLMEKGKDSVFDASKIKAVIDHVTPAKDSKTAMQGKILRQWAKRHKIKDFFDIGQNGVCHALFPEQGFVRPGNVIIMGDSHTCTYGALGALGIGVGTTDLEVGILKGVCALAYPKTIKINVSGNFQENVYPKDLILAIIGQIGVDGATNKIIEFTGNAIEAMSVEGRMTICNMAIEAGASCGICNPDEKIVDYLWKHIKDEYDSKEEALSDFKQYQSDKDAVYDEEIDFNIDKLEPQVTFGYKPDNVKSIKELEKTYVDQVYIGSCTNGRIEDLRAAAKILKNKKIKDSLRVIVSPATYNVYKEALKEGLIEIFADANCCVTNPTCGACLGMSNGVLAEGEVCASTTNRNFNGRMGKGAMVHLLSPASAAQTAIDGYINNPYYK